MSRMKSVRLCVRRVVLFTGGPEFSVRTANSTINNLYTSVSIWYAAKKVQAFLNYGPLWSCEVLWLILAWLYVRRWTGRLGF